MAYLNRTAIYYTDTNTHMYKAREELDGVGGGKGGKNGGKEGSEGRGQKGRGEGTTVRMGQIEYGRIEVGAG